MYQDRMDDLLIAYAEQNDISIVEAFEEIYESKIVSRFELAEAYLHNEGIYGYTQDLIEIFYEIFKIKG